MRCTAAAIFGNITVSVLGTALNGVCLETIFGTFLIAAVTAFCNIAVTGRYPAGYSIIGYLISGTVVCDAIAPFLYITITVLGTADFSVRLFQINTVRCNAAAVIRLITASGRGFTEFCGCFKLILRAGFTAAVTSFCSITVSDRYPAGYSISCYLISGTMSCTAAAVFGDITGSILSTALNGVCLETIFGTFLIAAVTAFCNIAVTGRYPAGYSIIGYLISGTVVCDAIAPFLYITITVLGTADFSVRLFQINTVRCNAAAVIGLITASGRGFTEFCGCFELILRAGFTAAVTSFCSIAVTSRYPAGNGITGYLISGTMRCTAAAIFGNITVSVLGTALNGVCLETIFGTFLMAAVTAFRHIAVTNRKSTDTSCITNAPSMAVFFRITFLTAICWIN